MTRAAPSLLSLLLAVLVATEGQDRAWKATSGIYAASIALDWHSTASAGPAGHASPAGSW